jgi:hypothetical protein
MMPGLHIVITAADHDQERRSSAPSGTTRAGFSCSAVSRSRKAALVMYVNWWVTGSGFGDIRSSHVSGRIAGPHQRSVD